MYNNETTAGWYYMKNRDNICKKEKIPITTRVLEFDRVIFLRSFRSNAWYHCFMETIPTFFVIKELFDIDIKKTKIYYSHIHQKQLDLIKSMGFDMAKVSHTDKPVFAHSSLVPIQKYNACHFKLMRKFFQKKYANEPSPEPYFLLIFRKSRGLDKFEELGANTGLSV